MDLGVTKGTLQQIQKGLQPCSHILSWTAPVQDDCFLYISARGAGGSPQHTQPTRGISHKEQGVNAPGMAFNHFGQELVANYSSFLLACSSVSFRVCRRNQPIVIICSLTHNSWAFLLSGSYFLTPSQCFPVSPPK